MYERLYQEHWTGGDSVLAATAFYAGVEAAVEEVAAWLADQPHTYEEAKSEYDYKAIVRSFLEGDRHDGND